MKRKRATWGYVIWSGLAGCVKIVPIPPIEGRADFRHAVVFERGKTRVTFSEHGTKDTARRHAKLLKMAIMWRLPKGTRRDWASERLDRRRGAHTYRRRRRR